jgi:hypothetical protein
VKLAWGLAAAILGWIVLTVVAEPWPDGPTHNDITITKYGSVTIPGVGEPTPAPSVKIMRASAGRCELSLALGTDHNVKPGTLVLVHRDPAAPAIAGAEILLTKFESSDGRLLGHWTDCPPLYEVRKANCGEVADAVVRSRPASLGPEEALVWARDLADVTARLGCAGWEEAGQAPKPGTDDYRRP